MQYIESQREISKSKSWKEIDKKLFELTRSEQTKFAGDIFELISKFYLLTESKYSATLKHVWLLQEVPETVKLKLNLPKSDEGIDLIAETKHGKFWAIQSKYRSGDNNNLTLGGKDGLATFSSLAFNYCKNIEHGLILTTANRPPKKINLVNNIGFETLETFNSLDDDNSEGWKILKAKCLNKIIKPNVFYPKPHQKKAIAKAIKYFSTFNRGKIIMPCGTGKSLMGFWLSREMKNKSVLIIVPSLALLHQTLKIWTKEFSINNIFPEWLCVCSDQTVRENQDSFISFTYDLGIKVTTDPSIIKSFLNNDSKNNTKIIFTTYQSGKKIAEGSKKFTYDFAIFDEAHKTVGHKDKLASLLMKDENISIKKRLFMTATERLFRANPNDYFTMDSKKDYGNMIYDLTFKSAIESSPPIISDYKIITFEITDTEIQKLHNDNKFIQVEKDLDNITTREFATAVALRKTIEKLNIKNAISFHSSIKRAKNFQKQQLIIDKIYPEYKKLNTFHVSGDMAVSERSSQMRLFREKKGLITNARCLTEGVDIPEIDCICFTDPKRSKIDIVQAAGRALRISKDSKKKFGYILIPIYVPSNMDPVLASKDSSFEEVVTVIGALSTQDSRIKEYLKSITQGKKPSKGNKVDGIISMNVLTKVDSKIFNESIKIKIWEKISRVNFATYKEAKEFARTAKIAGAQDWFEKKHLFPLDIPRQPNQVYEEVWEGWKEFLGTKPLPFDEVKKIVSKYKIKTRKEWYEVRHKIPNITKDPESVYEKLNVWKGWGDFLGNQNKRKIYISYEKAKAYAKSLNLKSSRYWFKLKVSELPENIPRSPHRIYSKDWDGWHSFLGYQQKKFETEISLEEHKKIALKHKIKNRADWIRFREKNRNYAKYPDVAFKKKDWLGWKDFLGVNYVEYKYLPGIKKDWPKFQVLTEFVKKNKINSQSQWKKFKSKLPDNFPRNPHKVYKKEWKGWDHFFGKK